MTDPLDLADRIYVRPSDCTWWADLNPADVEPAGPFPTYAAAEAALIAHLEAPCT